MDIFIKILSNLLFLVSGAATSFGAFWFYNQFPLVWFRDYDFVDHEIVPNENDRTGRPIPIHPDPRMRKFPDGVWFCSIFTFLFFAFYLLFGFTLLFICDIFCILLFSYIFVSDKKTQIIPDQFIFGLFFVSLLFMVNDLSYLQESGDSWYLAILTRLLGGIAGGLVLWLIGTIGSRLLKQEAIGMGDVKLIFACGIIVGIGGAFWVLILSFLLAFPPAVLNIVRNRKHYSAPNHMLPPITSETSVNEPGKESNRLPFAPFIVISATLYLMFPDAFGMIFYWYGNL